MNNNFIKEMHQNEHFLTINFAVSACISMLFCS